VDYITKPFDIQELRLKVRNTLRRAAGQNNPITSLPGERLTAQKLSIVLKTSHWAVIGISISGLTTFNEIYGFVARDDVLRAMALIITSVVDEIGTVDDFVGHPTETQFIVTTLGTRIPQLADRIQNRLDQAMLYFYPIHDREVGYVIHSGVDGGKIAIPFLQVNIQIISQQNSGYNRLEELTRALNLAL